MINFSFLKKDLMLNQVHPFEPTPDDFLLPENADQTEAVRVLRFYQVNGLQE
jgi:hypothetical protein